MIMKTVISEQTVRASFALTFPMSAILVVAVVRIQSISEQTSG